MRTKVVGIILIVLGVVYLLVGCTPVFKNSKGVSLLPIIGQTLLALIIIIVGVILTRKS